MLDQLEQVFGGQGSQDQFRDFIDRYTQGEPADGVDPQETVDRYQQIAPNISDKVYRDSAEEAFNRLSPEDRQQFAQWLRERAADHGAALPEQLQDPRSTENAARSSTSMADALSQLQREQPSFLQQIFGEGGALTNPIVRSAVAGIVAMAAQRLMNKR
jgi:hypothetical protein